MSSFAGLINSPSATRPVEEFVVRLVDVVTTFAKNKGYTASAQILHSPEDVMTGERRILVIFTLKTSVGNTHANIQISTTDLDGEPKVRSTQGFPSEFKPLIHDLQTLASGRQDTSGVQAVRQDDPAQVLRRPEVAAEPDEAPAPATNAQVSQAVVGSIDLATILNEAKKNEPTRQYIGASGISEECLAYHQLSLRGFPSDIPKPKMIRIFNEGHRVEPFVVKLLMDAGHKVEPLDTATGEQWEYTSHGGHHVCHLDGFITLMGGTERMTLEVKSMNRKMFESFVKKGVALSHPHYYDQCLDGMMLARSNGVFAQKCMFIAYCKDNSDFHVEIIQSESKRSIELLDRVTQVVVKGLSQRKHTHRHEYDCKQCFKQTSCWEPNLPTQTCQQCSFASPNWGAEGKKWICEIKAKEATELCSSFKLFRPEVFPWPTKPKA